MQLRREPLHARLGLGERGRGGLCGISARIERRELGASLGGAREQLVVALAAETPLRVGDPLQLAFQLFEPPRLRD